MGGETKALHRAQGGTCGLPGPADPAGSRSPHQAQGQAGKGRPHPCRGGRGDLPSQDQASLPRRQTKGPEEQGQGLKTESNSGWGPPS